MNTSPTHIDKRELVGAMGGSVELRVRLPDQKDVRLDQFDEMAKLAFLRRTG